MDSRHLSKAQCDWVNAQLSSMSHRLCLIRQRMKDRGFPENDKLYRLVYDAYDATLLASHHATNLCCQGQMGVTQFFVGKDGAERTEPSGD